MLHWHPVEDRYPLGVAVIGRLIVKSESTAIVVCLVLAGAASCAKPDPTANSGQAGDGELDVGFHAGVSRKAANEVVRRCTVDNPHVRRVTPLLLSHSNPRTYTLRVFAEAPISAQATKQLTACFNDDKAVTNAGWPV